jgi:F420-dependent oxidoreductase-like protein
MARFGLQFPYFSWPGSPTTDRQVLADAARTAEDVGFSSLYVMDHFFQLPQIGEATLEMHECYTTLGFMAGLTERVTLGALVGGVTYRHPGLLVKQVTTLDVLSGGRAVWGIGAAWFEREHDGLGVTFPPVAERFERLEETLRIATQMWSDDEGPFEGRHYRLAETICRPRPIQQPHPRIMVGGGGEKKTLRLVAQYADACNVGGSPEDVAHKFDVLRRHCDDVGRNYGDIEKTCITVALGDDLAERCKALVDVGAEAILMSCIDTRPESILKLWKTVEPLSG